MKDAVKRFKPARLRDLNDSQLAAQLDILKPAFDKFLSRLIRDNQQPDHWCGLTGVPSSPLKIEDSAAAHDCAIQLTAHIYGCWLHGQNLGPARILDSPYDPESDPDPGNPRSKCGQTLGDEDDGQMEDNGQMDDNGQMKDDVDLWNDEHEITGRSVSEEKAGQSGDEEAGPAPVLWRKRKWIAYGGRRHGQLEDEETEAGPSKRQRTEGGMTGGKR